MFEKLKKNLSMSTFKMKFELFQNFSIDQSRFSLLHRTSYNLLSPKPNLKGKRNDFFSRHKTLRLESSLCTAREPKLEDPPVIKSHGAQTTEGIRWNVSENSLAFPSIQRKFKSFLAHVHQFLYYSKDPFLRDRQTGRVKIKIKREARFYLLLRGIFLT